VTLDDDVRTNWRWAMAIRQRLVVLVASVALLIIGLMMIAGVGQADAADVLEELGSYVGPFAG
jgi:hypothetical protein